MDIAFNLLTTILIGAGIGFYYDSKSKSNFPIGVIIGTLTGMIIGMYSIYKRYIR